MTPEGRELVAGATGYVGGRLIERLLADGRRVRALARDPGRLTLPRGGAGHGGTGELEVASADLLTGRELERALEGCRTAYYLVHSMDAPSHRPAAGDGGFASRDRRAARNFARAARAADLERIVYLGGIVPAEVATSAHLASRLEVEETLLAAVPASTALRASIMVGAGSSSFRILVRLIERLRVVPLPAWRERRTQPIDERDAIEYLVRTPAVPAAAGRSLDVVGADVLSYAAMIERIAEHMGVGRTPLRLPAAATALTAPVVSALTDQPLGLVRPLMESLEHDLLPRDDSARHLYGLRPRPFDRAVERALREWEASEPLAAR